MGYARGRQVTLVLIWFIPGLQFRVPSLIFDTSRAPMMELIHSLAKKEAPNGQTATNVRGRKKTQFCLSSTATDDGKLLIRLASSTNPAMQKQVIEPAMHLGREAIPILHELLDHRRLQVVITSYSLLGEIADESSLPYLQAGLYQKDYRKASLSNCGICS